MKRINIKIIVISILILAIACSIGAGSVSALSAEGESLLNGLISVGPNLGVDIDGIIDNFVDMPEQPPMQNLPADENAKDELDKIFDTIGIGSDVLLITDLVAYLNRGGSFADWIYDNYGEDIEIPDSVRAMSTKDIVSYLMDVLLYPDDPNDNDEPISEESTVLCMLGDVDSDGKVSAMDARLALRTSASLDSLEGLAFEAADVNGDGRITANDARSILRYSARITSGF